MNKSLILKLIKENPFITQQEIAKKINLSRPAVANIISSLQQEGIILGKPYVLREDSYITCIGGMNMDFNFQLKKDLILETSNPVSSTISHGGVIRNVAENLVRLGSKVSLMSVVGEDAYGQELINENGKIMEVFAVDKVKHASTGGYYSILDKQGQMQIGFANMDINAVMNSGWILEHKKHLLMSHYIVADLNISSDAVDMLIDISNQFTIPLAIVTVSVPKMQHLPKELQGVELIITNKAETEAYFNQTFTSVEDACLAWLKTGVKSTVITYGSKGAYYTEKGNVHFVKAFEINEKDIVDTTGAGDAFSGALIHGLTSGMTMKESVHLASKSASLTIQQPTSVNKKLTNKIVKEIQQ